MKSIIRKLLGGAAAAAILVAGAASANADSWKYAMEESLTEVQGVYATKFKEAIEANSDHTVELYPYGTLGESADIMEQAQAGILQFVDQSPGFTGALIPEAQVFFVPYLLPTDQAQLARFFKESKAVNEMFPELYAEQGLELLVMFPEGEVAMTTKEPVKTCEDLNEVKFRVMTNPLLVEVVQGLRSDADTIAVGRGLWRPADQHHPGSGKPDLLPLFDENLRGDRLHHLCRPQQLHHRGDGQQGLL